MEKGVKSDTSRRITDLHRDVQKPQLKADAEALLAKLLADFAPMLGKAPAGM